MDLDEALLEAEEAMEKAVDYLKSELRGVRTGRASTGLVEFIKVDYYGSPTDLRELAMISVGDATQLMVKPYDATSTQEIVKAIQASGLGLNPMSDGKAIRINIPALSGERRQQLVGSIKQMGEQAKVTVRNARRDGNKHIDQAGKDKTLHLSEDDVKETKEEIQDLVKKYEKQLDDMITTKTKEVQEV
jgi:ribosome recycling factor